MTDSIIDKVTRWLTRVDHETVGELHGLGTSSTKLARDDNFATLGTRFHDKAEDTIASPRRDDLVAGMKKSKNSKHIPADCETSKQFVTQALTLSNSGETTVLNFLGIELEAVLGELEPLLDEGGQFTNAPSFVTQNFLGVGGADNNLGNDIL